MSEENKELVTRGHKARSSGRVGEWINTLDPDIEWDISGYPLPEFPERGRGRDAFVGHITTYWSRWNDYAQAVDEMIDAGDEIVVVLHEQARLRNSDKVVERNVTAVWTVRDGVRIRFRAFGDRDDALKAVGLAEQPAAQESTSRLT
jgi:ketosteroid isomerase-like protein